MTFQMIPNRFVRVKFWRVWRQIKQPKHSFCVLRKLLYFFGSMYNEIITIFNLFGHGFCLQRRKVSRALEVP
jgi:hypothetical protein